MNQVYKFVIFFSLTTLVMCLSHFYLWKRMVCDPELKGKWRKVGTVLALFLLLVTLALWPLRRFLDPALVQALLLIPHLWLAMLLLYCSFFALYDAVLLVRWSLLKLGIARSFLSRFVLISPTIARWRLVIVSFVVVFLTVNGVQHATQPPHIVTREIELAKFPRSLSGFKIVQLTDLHISRLQQIPWLRDIVDRVNGLQPDIIVITGDIIDGAPHDISKAVSELSRLRASHGVYYVTGNHEYYSGIESWYSVFSSFNMQLLDGRSVTIGALPHESFNLIGVGDYDLSRFSARDSSAELLVALKMRQSEGATVLLAHQPKSITELPQGHDVGLVLSGHTHAGQIWPFGCLVLLVQPFLKGLHQFDQGSQIYISPGTGYWGPPVRIGSTSEITELRLISR